MNVEPAPPPVTDHVDPFAHAPIVTLSCLTLNRPIMILAPHADDESLGCGGLIAGAAAAQTPITAVLLTDGVRSHLGSKRYPPSQRRALREAEFTTALEVLGARACRRLFFGQPDGFLTTALAHTQIRDALVREVIDQKIATVFVTWEADPHPDHAAAAALAQDILDACPGVRVFAYPIWGLTRDHGFIAVAAGGAVRLNISQERELKLRAIRQHRSQTTDLISDAHDPFRLTADLISMFCTEHEVFIPVSAQTSADVGSIETTHFDKLYQTSFDPWSYETSDYEKRKYAKTLSMLPRQCFRRGFELGCSIGVLTEELSKRCSSLIAADCAQAAVLATRARMASRQHVTVHQMRVPNQLPSGTFDLIVLSEVLYFFNNSDLVSIAAFVIDRLEPDGMCILVNYLGDTLSPQTGDGAAVGFMDATFPALSQVAAYRERGFRIDVLSRIRTEIAR
jgi:LmbE family N-acetylglucosaminyl deacetylase